MRKSSLFIECEEHLQRSPWVFGIVYTAWCPLTCFVCWDPSTLYFSLEHRAAISLEKQPLFQLAMNYWTFKLYDKIILNLHERFEQNWQGLVIKFLVSKFFYININGNIYEAQFYCYCSYLDFIPCEFGAYCELNSQ